MLDPVHLHKFDDRPRQVRGRTPVVRRNQQQHGTRLRDQLNRAINSFGQRIQERQATLPDIPGGVQVLIKGATSAEGNALLESATLKGFKLEVLEERSNGLIIALSPDTQLRQLNKAIENFRIDARSAPSQRYPQGRRKTGVNTVFYVDDIEPTTRALRIGEELSQITIGQNQRYVVDIEIAAGTELGEIGAVRRQEFSQYLSDGGGDIFGNGPIVEDDYALYRAEVGSDLLGDLLDVHIWVKYVDLLPRVELEGITLRDITAATLPQLNPPPNDSAIVCVIDSGVALQHPIVNPAMNGKNHQVFIPNETSLGDTGVHGHGTAVTSIAALGSLRNLVANPGTSPQIVPIVLAKVLDDNALLPSSVNVKTVMPLIVTTMKGSHGVIIYNHSIASRAQANPERMSIWAESIDRTVYDDGGEGALFVLCTGNIDNFRPTLQQVQTDIANIGYPLFLKENVYRLRNPSQAINALTVGGYVRDGITSFGGQSSGLAAIGQTGRPSPFTRSGFGYLGEIKPEVVEEAGNWRWNIEGGINLRGDVTDVPLAAHDYVVTGRLVKFGSATSWAAPKVANLAAQIQDEFDTNNVDLIRAVIINSAQWPDRFGSIGEQLQIMGYGVPSAERALVIGGARCSLVIEDNVKIGNAHFYRIPWPSDLFEQAPETEIRVSITLSYRAPVRKSNRKYRGTVLEWKLSKRGESLADFRDRSIYQGVAVPGIDDDAESEEEESSAIANWNWTVGANLRKRGTAQKDWFEAPASYFGDELYLSVLGKRGWLSASQQQQGWFQKYAIVISIEVLGTNIPIHERIAQLVAVPIEVQS